MRRELLFSVVILCWSVAIYAALTDPTRPANPKAFSLGKYASHFQVTAIFISPNRRTANINGQLYKVGEKLPSGFEVIAIEPHNVEIKKGSEEKTLHLMPLVRQSAFSRIQVNT